MSNWTRLFKFCCRSPGLHLKFWLHMYTTVTWVDGLEWAQFNPLKLTSTDLENSPVVPTNYWNNHPKVATCKIHIKENWSWLLEKLSEETFHNMTKMLAQWSYLESIRLLSKRYFFIVWIFSNIFRIYVEKLTCTEQNHSSFLSL